MPQQTIRLIILFSLLGTSLFIARHYLVPKTFGALGHYRAAAIELNASKPMIYAGHEVCETCHPDKAEEKSAGRHRTVACEVCHGAAAGHAENPTEIKPKIPRDRSFCPVCHGYNSSRPTGFPQIDPVSHNPVQPCMTCHKPHAPETPRVPQECSACHGEIARTKAVSKHAQIQCTVCHDVQEQHKITPMASKPGKPQTREFCAQCHGLDAKGSKEIPRVDLATHNPRYVCWQCHYSHLPEVE